MTLDKLQCSITLLLYKRPKKLGSRQNCLHSRYACLSSLSGRGWCEVAAALQLSWLCLLHTLGHSSQVSLYRNGLCVSRVAWLFRVACLFMGNACTSCMDFLPGPRTHMICCVQWSCMIAKRLLHRSLSRIFSSYDYWCTHIICCVQWSCMIVAVVTQKSKQEFFFLWSSVELVVTLGTHVSHTLLTFAHAACHRYLQRVLVLGRGRVFQW